jgi:hypothetical protein
MKKHKKVVPFCRRRGWKTLCRRFRKHLNEKVPRGDLSFLEWTELRVQAAKEFIKVEGIEKEKGDALIGHVPPSKMRGMRKCMACLEV